MGAARVDRPEASPHGNAAGDWVVPLASLDAGHLVDAGTKAANLARLAQVGFPVPSGFVVTVRAFDRLVQSMGPDGTKGPVAAADLPMPEEVGAAIRAATAGLEDVPLAVRSSGVAEDLPDASFAGQYETVLGARGAEAVLEAVRTCWASAFAPRVLAYRASMRKAGPPRMAVLVQKLVPADAAGVAFTANPVTGDRHEILVSAVRGLGERLVSGQATADEWSVRDGHALCLRSAEGALAEGQVLGIAELARRVESTLGGPQDIEWAASGGDLFLLQARPITALPEPADWKSPEPGVWLRNFRLGEWLGDPVTPLFGSWLVERLDDRAYEDMRRALRLPTPRPYHVFVNGWYFATGNFLPRSVPQMLGLGVRYFLPGFLLRPRRMAMITTSLAYWGLGWFEREWRETIRPRYRAAVEEAERRIDASSPPEQLEIVDRLADAAGDSFYSLLAVAGSAWKPEYALARFYGKHLQARIGGNHQDLLRALGDAHRGTSTGVMSLDWAQPPATGFGTVPGEIDALPLRSRAEGERTTAEAAARDALRESPRRLRRFERLLGRAQHAARLREEQTAEFTLAWPAMRRALLHVGEALAGQGLLDAREDVFFLEKDELFALVRRGREAPPLGREVSERRARWQRQRRLAAPLRLGVFPPLAARLMARFEATLAGPGSRGQALVSGMPASPGRATGRVRVIRSPEQFDRLGVGEILVAPMTNPAWTPLFRRAAAVVTDTGSLMAHASLVAREFGIPAVVATGDGTARLRDGQSVTVDGSRGVVEPA